MDCGVERESLGRREAHEASASAALDEVDDLAREHHGSVIRRGDASRTVFDDGSLLEALAGIHEALPHPAVGIEVLATREQQRFRDAARAALATHEARGQHAGPVGHEQVARMKVLHDIREDAVLDRAVATMQHEQATGIARLCGSLGDQLVGQRVVEI